LHGQPVRIAGGCRGAGGLPAAIPPGGVPAGHLPLWYMSVRAPLTMLASFGVLLTASYYMHLESDRVKALESARQPAPQS